MRTHYFLTLFYPSLLYYHTYSGRRRGHCGEHPVVSPAQRAAQHARGQARRQDDHGRVWVARRALAQLDLRYIYLYVCMDGVDD